MGGGFYNDDSRYARSVALGYHSKSREQIFTRHGVHSDMDSTKVKIREARDSEDHPNTVPIQLYLDVTGSMGNIPHMFIKEGLPTLVSTIVKAGIPDVALMFGAIGDVYSDKYPLQVGQFESSDEKLDHWLTNTFLEGGGGGNYSESYSLAWYFSANHVQTDAWEKRKQKGFVFTIGDEPLNVYLSRQDIKEVMGDNAVVESDLLNSETLYKQASINNNVYHLHVAENSNYNNKLELWKKVLGENFIIVQDYKEIPKIISSIVIQVNTATTDNNIESINTVETNINSNINFDINSNINSDIIL